MGKDLNKTNYNQIDKKLPGTFWGLTTFFNVKKNSYRIEHYKAFRLHSQKQGLKLITVECAFKDNPFELKPEDADILIQVRSNSLLWHKEKLLDIAFKNLPLECDKIVWVDCDVIFLNQDWIKETCDLLEKYEFVKPFEKAIRLSSAQTQKIIKNKLVKLEEENYNKITDCEYSYNPDLPMKYKCCFSWALRKEILNDVGFYTKSIVGNGDLIMTKAFINYSSEIDNFNVTLNKDILAWTEKINQRINNTVSYTKGDLLHLFHGTTKNRTYYDRNYILKNNNFDPNNDLKENIDGCWEWATPKKNLHHALIKYFNYRNENNSILMNILIAVSPIANQLIGQIGIIIKKIYPKLYFYLKKND